MLCQINFEIMTGPSCLYIQDLAQASLKASIQRPNREGKGAPECLNSAILYPARCYVDRFVCSKMIKMSSKLELRARQIAR